MAAVLTPRLLRRGFELFVVTSIVGYAGVLLYGDNFPRFLASIRDIHWVWVLVGLGLASMDWFGGGLRLWLVTRQVHPHPPLRGMFLAGGMSAWGSYLTPFQSGAAPMMVYTMRRYGVSVPVARGAWKEASTELEPPPEPPGMRSRSHGLWVGP